VQSQALSRSVLETLAREWGLGSVSDCRTLRIGTSNALFRLASAQGSVVVRRVTRAPDRVLREHALLRYLAGTRFPVVPALESRTGATVLTTGDATYALYPFIVGHHPDPGDAGAAAVAGQALACLHALTRGHPCAPPNPRPPMHHRFLASAARFGARVDAVLADPSLHGAHADARWLAKRVQLIARRLRAPALAHLPSALIHGDFNPENLLIDDDALAAVLDFDLATDDARVADLAVALHYLARPARRGPLAAPVAEALLGAYEEHARLSAPERHALAALIEAKAARAPMRGLRHVLKARPERRAALSDTLHAQLQGLRALDQHPGWRAALLRPRHGRGRVRAS
jgi:Ser/Thr protein kinase RdoA (MazF antagonist)